MSSVGLCVGSCGLHDDDEDGERTFVLTILVSRLDKQWKKSAMFTHQEMWK